MSTEPNLAFDIDALFAHMIDKLGHNLADELDWVFTFRSPDVSKLASLEARLSDEFITVIQEDVEEIDADDTVSPGDPMLSVVRRGALTPKEVKQIADRMSRLAKDKGVLYDGVQCYDIMDSDVEDDIEE